MANEKKTKGESEQARQKKEEKARATRRRNRQLIGLALAIFIVVGLISTVNFIINTTRNMLDNEDERMEYQTRFEPIVWFDLLPFDSVTQMDENSLKQVAIWGAFTKLSDTVPRDEYGQALISSAEVDLYGVELFGPDFRFTVHETFRDALWDLTYVFDPETKMYSVPSTGLMPLYYAKVVEIKREAGGVRRVVMGYISSRTSDDQVVATLDYDHPSRYVDFMLRRDGNEYYLFAIQPNTTHVPQRQDPAALQPDVPASVPDLSFPESQSTPSSLPEEDSSVSDSGASAAASGEASSASAEDSGSTSVESEDDSGSSS